MKPRLKGVLPCLVVLTVALIIFGLRLCAAASNELTRDELLTCNQTKNGTIDNGNPYYVLARMVALVFGGSAFSLRAFSVFCVTVATFMFCWICHTCRGVDTGQVDSGPQNELGVLARVIVVFMLLNFNFTMFLTAISATPQAFALLLSVLSIVVLWIGLAKENSILTLFLYAAICFFACGVHVASNLAVLSEIIWCGLSVVQSLRMGRRSAALRGSLFLIVGVILFVGVSGPLSSFERTHGAMYREQGLLYYFLVLTGVPYLGFSQIAAWFALLFFLLPCRRNRRDHVLAFTFIYSVVTALFYGEQRFGADYGAESRSTTNFSAIVCLVTCVLTARLKRDLNSLIAIVLVGGAFTLGLGRKIDRYSFSVPPLHQAANFVINNANNGDVVLLEGQDSLCRFLYAANKSMDQSLAIYCTYIAYPADAPLDSDYAEMLRRHPAIGPGDVPRLISSRRLWLVSDSGVATNSAPDFGQGTEVFTKGFSGGNNYCSVRLFEVR